MVNVSCSSPLSGTLDSGESESDRLIFYSIVTIITRIVDYFDAQSLLRRERYRLDVEIRVEVEVKFSVHAKRAGTWVRAMTTPLSVPRGVLKEATGLSCWIRPIKTTRGSQIYHKAPASKVPFIPFFLYTKHTRPQGGTCSANEV